MASATSPSSPALPHRSGRGTNGAGIRPRPPADLPGRGAGRGQDLRHARRGLSPRAARHRCRRRLRRDPQPPQDRGPDPRSRGHPPAAGRVPRRRCSRRWTSTRCSPGIPNVALVDEFAHTNAPGSRHTKRWEDVEELLAAGIDVDLDRQHPAPRVGQRRRRADHRREAARDGARLGRAGGRSGRARRHGPRGAAPPHGPRQHLRRPRRSTPRSATTSASATSRALRELALLWVADKVDDSLQDYMVVHGIDHSWETRERVVVAVTGAPSGEHLIRRAARMASRAKGDLVGVHISADDGLATAPSELLDQHRQLLADLGRRVPRGRRQRRRAGAASSSPTAEHATQLVLGATHRSRWSRAGRRVGHQQRHPRGRRDRRPRHQPGCRPGAHDGREPALGRRRARPQLSRRRQLAGWVTAAASASRW